MKITIKRDKVIDSNRTLEYLIEREQGTYNNIVESVTFNSAEISGMTEDEIKTFGYIKLKSLAKRVFEAIEILNEPDNPVGFTLVSSVPKRINILGNTTLQIGQTAEYQAIAYDQYEQTMNVNMTWQNKTITATQVGDVIIKASVGEITASMTVKVTEKQQTKEEILSQTVAQLSLENADLKQQLQTLASTVAQMQLK